MQKIKCIDKQKDPVSKKNIYLLEDEQGNKRTASADEIKIEIRAGNYDFVNLQIDKAGRLVKKVEEPEKKQQTTDDNEFTVQDLLNMNEVKGKKIRALDTKNNKYKRLIGQSYCVNDVRNWGIHNSVYAYSEEDGKLYIVNLGSVDGKNKMPICELVAKNYKIDLVLRHSYIVDLKANPKGRYTVIEVGKYKEEFIGDLYDMRAFKIHDNVEGKDTWVSEGFLGSYMNKNIGYNEFTNAYIQLDQTKLLQENIKFRDINYEMGMFKKFVSSLENVFKHEIDNNCLFISYDEDSYSVSGETIEMLKSAETIFEKLNTVDLFNINNKKFHDIIMQLLTNEILEMTEVNGKKIYYVGIENSEVHMSTDKNKIKQIYDNYRSDSEFCECDMNLFVTTNIDEIE